jgi:hypothetical protein
MQGKSHSVLGRTRVQDIGPDKLLPPNDDAYHDLGTTMTRETPVATSGERKLLMDYLLSSDVGTCVDCGIIVRVLRPVLHSYETSFEHPRFLDIPAEISFYA